MGTKDTSRDLVDGRGSRTESVPKVFLDFVTWSYYNSQNLCHQLVYKESVKCKLFAD